MSAVKPASSLADREALDGALDRRDERSASTLLLRVLQSGSIDHSHFDLWGEYAGKIEKLIGADWERRFVFWDGLRRILEGLERRSRRPTHKGLVYFKLGAFSLVTGKPLTTAIAWLGKAFREDERLFDAAVRADKDAVLPEQASARRLLSIVEAFKEFSQDVRDARTRDVINNAQARVGLFFVALYDESIRDVVVFRMLNEAYFDRLLGATAYRGIVQESYRAAAWLCERADEINRTINEKYGLAQATLVLCGSTIEAILLADDLVRRRYRAALLRKGVRSRTAKGERWQYKLGGLVAAYLNGGRKLRPDLPEVAAGLVFIMFARNLIHPEKAQKHRRIPIEMAFANFAWSVTNHVIFRMAERARPRK